MKTQITLVQHNEEVLESKRQHCKLYAPGIRFRDQNTDNTTPQTSKSSKHSRVRSNSSVATEGKTQLVTTSCSSR